MKKILLSFTIMCILVVTVCSKVNAASYNFNFSGPSEATNGQTVTLTITATGLTGKVTLSSTNATLSSSSVWVEKNTVNVTAKITGFPAKITATPSELTDNEYNIVNLSSKTVTINEKKTSTGGSSNSGGSNQSGGSSNSGSSSGGTTNKPSGGSSSSGSSGGSSSSGSSSTSKPNKKPSGGTSATQSPDGSYVPNENNIGSENSSNNYLQSITLSAGTLSPEFYRETFEYTVENLDDTITELEISAVAEDERASISGLGIISLTDGENRIPISVTAENGNVREYILIVNRKQNIQESDLRLQTLEISKINRNGEFQALEIPFNKENFEYSVDVEEDIIDLDVNPTVEKEGIIVEVTGDKNLKEGENIVSITLSSQEDENIQTTYIIKVNRQSALQTSAEVVKVNENWKIVVLVIELLVLIGEIVLYVYLKKKRKIK